MPIDNDKAAKILDEEAATATENNADSKWLRYVTEISEMCETADIRTHITFLGTAILAKATDPRIDVFAVKVNDDPGCYSARNLGNQVLARGAAAHGFNIGVTGREPLNNMPYFRMERFGDGTRVHNKSRPIIARLEQMLGELAAIRSKEKACAVLRAFIVVRRRYVPQYPVLTGEYRATVDDLISLIEAFVGERSEGGRRAQAVAAGILDLFAGGDRVVSGRINDPSRHYPGDVAVGSSEGEGWEKAFEVRDKTVSLSDIQLFGQECLNRGVKEAAIIAVAANQRELPHDEFRAWAKGRGIGITVYYRWRVFVEQAIFWGAVPSPTAASDAIPLIHKRLVSVEASTEGVARWSALVAPFKQSKKRSKEPDSHSAV